MERQNWKKSIACFMTAQNISLFGSSLVQYAIIWYITLTTSSGKMLTISTICGFVPQIVISLFAGVWIDRYHRKKIIMLTDTVIALSTLLLALAFLAGYRNVWFLFAVLMIRSAGTGIQTPAVNAVIPQIVPKDQLMRINGISSTLSSIMMFLSPAVSGALLSVMPLEATLLVDVVTAIIGVSITATIKIKPVERKADISTGFAELKAGLKYMKENRCVRRLLIYQMLILFLISPSAFLTPLMVSRTFGPEIWRLTASEMTYSLGMVMGGVLISLWGGFHRKTVTIMVAGAAYGFFMLGLGFAPIYAVYLVCNTAIGITSPCYQAPITVTIQEKVSPDMQGRVFSFMQIATACSLPFGMIFFGPLSDLVPVQTILIGGGICVLTAELILIGIDFFREV